MHTAKNKFESDANVGFLLSYCQWTKPENMLYEQRFMQDSLTTLMTIHIDMLIAWTAEFMMTSNLLQPALILGNK